ncbi:MAG: efflux RND transporter permease subunit [Candidatus Omnitrophota bacterium]
MKKLAEFSVKNSMLVNLLTFFIFAGGLYSVLHLQRNAFPNVSWDIVQITTTYRGSSAEEVEKLITTPLEKELNEVDDIDQIISSSYEGVSLITIQLDPELKNKNKTVNDIQRAIDQTANLPQDANKPVVLELETKQQPVLKISIAADIEENILQGYVEGLQEELEELPDMARVSRQGYRDREIWVEVDPDKLRSFYVSLEEIMGALQRRNITLPAGKISTTSDEFYIKTVGEFFAVEEIADVIIRSNDAGESLRIRDVARVIDSFEDENVINKVNGCRAISLVAMAKEKGDVIRLTEYTRKIIEKFQKNHPELHVVLSNDLSYYIKRRLNVLRSNGIFGFIFVIIVLLIFLRPITAILTALGIPIAFFITFCLMLYLGISINLLSMFALIMVLGMLVDDGIIIAENIMHYIEKGIAPREAAIKGAAEFMLPVLATVLTTIAAFSPLLFMSGIMGKFIKQMPLIVIIALIASVIEAFIMLPAHMADFAQPIPQGVTDRAHKKWFIYIKSKYSSLLNWALFHRYFIVAFTFVIFVSSVIFAVRKIPVKLFPDHGVEQFFIQAETAIGTPLDRTNELLGPVEKLVAALPEKELDSYMTTVGRISDEHGHAALDKNGSHFAQITVYLTPLKERKRTVSEIIDGLQSGLKKIKGFEKLEAISYATGPPVGKPVEIKIRGEKHEIIQKIASEIKNYLSVIPGVYDIADTFDLGKKEINLDIDRDKLHEAGLNYQSVAATVRNVFAGGVATSIQQVKAGEEEIDVLVRFPLELRNSISAFNEILIPNSKGKLIPLKNIARLQYKKGISNIQHLDGKRMIVVQANIDKKKTTPLQVAQLLNKKFKDIPDRYIGYTLRFGGEQEQTMESIKSLFRAFIFAFFLIFIILTTQFRSLIQPLVVMLTIPFSIIGVIFAYYLHQEPFSFIGLLGLIGLAGVVVNDSIVLMDYINRLRRQGLSRSESIQEAGVSRFRPVILTTVTTVFGLMPTAYGIGGFDPFVRPMALTIAWGLFFASTLTLIVIPCVYAIIDDITVKIAKHPTAQPNHNRKPF